MRLLLVTLVCMLVRTVAGRAGLQVEANTQEPRFLLTGEAGRALQGELGAGLPGPPSVITAGCAGDVCLAWPGLAELTITRADDLCFQVNWVSSHLSR